MGFYKDKVKKILKTKKKRFESVRKIMEICGIKNLEDENVREFIEHAKRHSKNNKWLDEFNKKGE